MVGPKEAGTSLSEQGVVTVETVIFRRPSDIPQVEIDRSCNPNFKLARVLFISIRRTHGVPTRKGVTTSRQLPSIPSYELTQMCGDNRVARQRALIGDSLNDQQGGDNLFGPSPYQTNPPKIAVVEKHRPESQRGRTWRSSRRSGRSPMAIQ